MRKLLLAFSTAVVVLVAIVIVRTLMHTPLALEPVSAVSIDVDDDLVARHLSEAIAFPTVSNQNPADMDEAAFDGFIAWTRETYPEVEGAMDLTLFGKTMLFEWRGTDSSRQPVLVTGHYDVVPVIPGTESTWEHPPFEGRIEDSIIWGRGALDDKSAVIAMLEAASWLLKQGFVPQRTIYFSFGHDEEIGGSNGAGAVTQYLKDKGVQLEWSLDEGSFVFDDMIPGVDELAATINTAEKGSVTLLIVAKGAGGHSSMPPRQTAVGVLADAITKLENHPVPGGLTGLSLDMFDTLSRHMPFVPRMLFANRWLFGGILEDQLSSSPMMNAFLRTTTAPTMLSGSVKTNVLPIEAIAAVNFRIHPRDSVDDVINYVKSVVESENVEVRAPDYAGRAASGVSDANTDGFALITQSVREAYGDVVITPGLMIAASDSRHYGQVADNAFRFNPIIVTADDLTGFHGTNEKISVAHLVQGVKTYVQILRHGGS